MYAGLARCTIMKTRILHLHLAVPSPLSVEFISSPLLSGYKDTLVWFPYYYLLTSPYRRAGDPSLLPAHPAPVHGGMRDQGPVPSLWKHKECRDVSGGGHRSLGTLSNHSLCIMSTQQPAKGRIIQ